MNRHLERRLIQQVFHGRRADERIADIHFAHRPGRHDPVEPAQPLRRIPRDRLGIDESGNARPGGDKQLGGRDLVELADDAVARRARQAQRGHQRRQSNHNAQHGQHHPPRPGEHAGQRFIKEIANRDSRAGNRGGDSSGVCGRGRRLRGGLANRNVGQLAIDDVDAPPGPIGHVFIVRHDDQREALLVQFLEQVEQVGGRLRVQIAGRFVAQQQAGRTDQRPSDGDALLLAAGKLARQEIDAMAEAHAFDRRPSPGLAIVRGLLAVDLRQHHVFQHRPIRQQVERLKHEADALASQPGPLAVGQLCRVDAVEQIGAAGRMVQAAEHVEQRRFSRARRPGDRKPFAAFERQDQRRPARERPVRFHTFCRRC